MRDRQAAVDKHQQAHKVGSWNSEEITAEEHQPAWKVGKRLAVETPEERELRLECYSTKCGEQQSVQPQLPLLPQCFIQSQDAKISCKHGYTGHANMLNLFTKISWLAFTQT